MAAYKDLMNEKTPKKKSQDTSITQKADSKQERIGEISNVSKTISTMQKKLDQEIAKNKKEIKSNEDLQVMRDSMNSVLSKMSQTMGHLGKGFVSIAASTARTSADMIKGIGSAINEDLKLNKQNIVGMALSKTSPIFGYFVSRFMQTEAFQKAKERIKIGLADALGSVTDKFRTGFRSFVNKVKFSKDQNRSKRPETYALRERENSKSKRRYEGSAIRENIGRIPKLKRGGYITKGGAAYLHSAEVVGSAKDIMHPIQELGSTNTKILNAVLAIHNTMLLALSEKEKSSGIRLKGSAQALASNDRALQQQTQVIVRPVEQLVKSVDERMGVTSSLTSLAAKSQIDQAANLRTYVRSSENFQKVGMLKVLQKAYSEVQNEYQDPANVRMLRAMLAIQDAIGGSIGTWPQVFQKMLIQHPLFRTMYLSFNTIRKTFGIIYKPFYALFKSRGGVLGAYKASLAHSGAPLNDISQNLGTFYMQSMIRLDNVSKFTKATAEATRDISTAITGKKYPRLEGISLSAGLFSLFGKMRFIFNKYLDLTARVEGALIGLQLAMAGGVLKPIISVFSTELADKLGTFEQRLSLGVDAGKKVGEFLTKDRPATAKWWLEAKKSFFEDVRDVKSYFTMASTKEVQGEFADTEDFASGKGFGEIGKLINELKNCICPDLKKICEINEEIKEQEEENTEQIAKNANKNNVIDFVAKLEETKKGIDTLNNETGNISGMTEGMAADIKTIAEENKETSKINRWRWLRERKENIFGWFKDMIPFVMMAAGAAWKFVTGIPDKIIGFIPKLLGEMLPAIGKHLISALPFLGKLVGVAGVGILAYQLTKELLDYLGFYKWFNNLLEKNDENTRKIVDAVTKSSQKATKDARETGGQVGYEGQRLTGIRAGIAKDQDKYGWMSWNAIPGIQAGQREHQGEKENLSRYLPYSPDEINRVREKFQKRVGQSVDYNPMFDDPNEYGHSYEERFLKFLETTGAKMSEDEKTSKFNNYEESFIAGQKQKQTMQDKATGAEKESEGKRYNYAVNKNWKLDPAKVKTVDWFENEAVQLIYAKNRAQAEIEEKGAEWAEGFNKQYSALETKITDTMKKYEPEINKTKSTIGKLWEKAKGTDIYKKGEGIYKSGEQLVNAVKSTTAYKDIEKSIVDSYEEAAKKGEPALKEVVAQFQGLVEGIRKSTLDVTENQVEQIMTLLGGNSPKEAIDKFIESVDPKYRDQVKELIKNVDVEMKTLADQSITDTVSMPGLIVEALKKSGENQITAIQKITSDYIKTRSPQEQKLMNSIVNFGDKVVQTTSNVVNRTVSKASQFYDEFNQHGSMSYDRQ